MQVRVVGCLGPSFAGDGHGLVSDRRLEPGAPIRNPAVQGTLASARGANGRRRLTRDPLWLNKLFWASEATNSIVVATRPYHLVGECIHLSAVRALPRGCTIDIDGDRVRCERAPAPAGPTTTPDVRPFLDNGVGQAALRRRFADLHKFDGTAELDRFIRARRYRWAVPEETS
jgi:hypothetical protein